MHDDLGRSGLPREASANMAASRASMLVSLASTTAVSFPTIDWQMP
jgi:hypothetical protein